METYKQMKDRHQAEVNALPLAWAFSQKQYREKLAEWNITEEEAKAGAIVGIGNGGFIRTADRETVIDTFKRIQGEKAAAIEADKSGDGFIYQMFLCELNNREYSYTQDVDETLAALNITADDLENNTALQHGLDKAIETIITAGDPFDEWHTKQRWSLDQKSDKAAEVGSKSDKGIKP